MQGPTNLDLERLNAHSSTGDSNTGGHLLSLSRSRAIRLRGLSAEQKRFCIISYIVLLVLLFFHIALGAVTIFNEYRRHGCLKYYGDRCLDIVFIPLYLLFIALFAFLSFFGCLIVKEQRIY